MLRWVPPLSGLVICVSLLCGCGAIISTASLVEADAAVEAARLEQAEEHSTYEFLCAEAYLDKAREEWAFSDFQHAEEYAQLAINFAQAALERAIANPTQTAPRNVDDVEAEDDF